LDDGVKYEWMNYVPRGGILVDILGNMHADAIWEGKSYLRAFRNLDGRLDLDVAFQYITGLEGTALHFWIHYSSASLSSVGV